MAKIKSPCMSMDARGQLGKSLVFLGWKGIKDVRSFVVPANPRTAGQVAQRNFLTEALGVWHFHFLGALDFAAYNLRASISSTALSGYNFFIRGYLFAKKNGLYPTYPHDFSVKTNSGGDIHFHAMVSSGIVMKVRFGYKPGIFGEFFDLTRIGQTSEFEFSGSGFLVGKYVYFEFVIGSEDYHTISGFYKVLVLP